MSLKQLSFFNNDSEELTPKVDCKDQTIWRLFTDGAARNNPGPAGIGFYLQKNNEIVCQQGFFVGKKTNNQAEYLALLIGLCFVKEFVKPLEKIAVFSDSQLLIRQMNGEYKVKDVQLKKLKLLVLDILKEYQYSFCHIYRNDNQLADELANRGVDKKTPLPKRILDALNQYEIL